MQESNLATANYTINISSNFSGKIQFKVLFQIMIFFVRNFSRSHQFHGRKKVCRRKKVSRALFKRKKFRSARDFPMFVAMFRFLKKKIIIRTLLSSKFPKFICKIAQ